MAPLALFSDEISDQERLNIAKDRKERAGNGYRSSNIFKDNRRYQTV